MIKNSVGGNVLPLTWEQLIYLVSPAFTERVTQNAAREDVDGVAVFEVRNMDSSARGNKSFLIYGPGCTYKTLDAIAKGVLGDTPSRHAYPIAYWSKR